MKKNSIINEVVLLHTKQLQLQPADQAHGDVVQQQVGLRFISIQSSFNTRLLTDEIRLKVIHLLVWIPFLPIYE